MSKPYYEEWKDGLCVEYIPEDPNPPSIIDRLMDQNPEAKVHCISLDTYNQMLYRVINKKGVRWEGWSWEGADAQSLSDKEEYEVICLMRGPRVAHIIHTEEGPGNPKDYVPTCVERLQEQYPGARVHGMNYTDYSKVAMACDSLTLDIAFLGEYWSGRLLFNPKDVMDQAILLRNGGPQVWIIKKR